LGSGPAQAARDIAKTIDRNNVQQYKDMLVPACYRAVERGDFILKTGALSYEYKHWNKFVEAAQKNEGKFDVNSEGDLIDKSTGKIPYYNIYGWPFPHIAPNDPKAAVKMMYNFQFNKYRTMGFRMLSYVSWIDSKKGEHRHLVIDTIHLNLTGRPPGQEMPMTQNPNHYIKGELGLMYEPYDMLGLNQLNFDYMDTRDFTLFSYVPALRRVRQTSGVARSDPFYGSDAWADLSWQWDGKNRWMDWKIVGEKTILVPFSSTEKIAAKMDSDGTFYVTRPVTKYGYQVPNWTGATWAPVTVTWVPRKVWVIEQMPKDPYYAWGLHTNYMDQETYTIFIKEVNDKAGQFRTWYLQTYSYSEAPNGNNNVGIKDDSLTIDEKSRHATIGRFINAPGLQSAIYQPWSKMSLKIFNKSTIMQQSK
jgi:hypothetical protein